MTPIPTIAIIGVAIAATALVSGVVFAPLAQATPDDSYIKILKDEGVGYRFPRDQLISEGHQICTDLSHGKSPGDEATSLFNAADYLTEHDATTLVDASIVCYCLQYKDW
jgi:hypothetical protein